MMQMRRKRISFAAFCICAFVILCLPACQRQTQEIRNQDDGILVIDADRSINFYLANDETGPDPITQQCLAWIENQKPVSVETREDYFEGYTLSAYQINGIVIRIFEDESDPEHQTVLWSVELDATHVLKNGIRIGSTEEELKKTYEGKPEWEFTCMDWLSDTDTRYYMLNGDWYIRYPICFEVDMASGLIKRITYDFDE